MKSFIRGWFYPAAILLGVCPPVWAGTVSTGAPLPDLVELQNREAALRAIAEGGDVNERSADGTTALHWAAHQGDVELVERLLAEGADATVRNDYGVTPIAAAAVEGDYRIIKALLDAGADVDSPNPEGQTVLMVVARTGRVATAQALLAAGADVNAREEFGGQTALMWAAARQQPEMVRLLIEHGAELDARGRDHDWQRRVMIEPRLKIFYRGGFTPLLYAAREGCLECVRELVSGGADIDLSDPDGITPLVLALLNRHFDTAATLIELGADVDQWDWWGRSPLYVAIELNQIPASRRGDLPSLDEKTGLDIASMLLEQGANVNMRLKHQAPMRSEPGDRGLRYGSTDAFIVNTGSTALHVAAKAGDDAAIRLLLEHGANVSARNAFGITPLLAAAGVGNRYGPLREYAIIGRYKTGAQAVETMKILLAAGADINDRATAEGIANRDPQSLAGLTVAHGAAAEGWPEVIQFLHDIGFDIKSIGKHGETPRDFAVGENREETVALIDKLLGAS